MNVDECSINHKTKSNYSWTPKYEWKDFQNAPFSDSISVVLWVVSNGDWVWSIIKHTINSEIFSTFSKHLKGWTMKKYPSYRNEFTFILDNCSSHRSSVTMRALAELGCRIDFIPAYSPQLAPVELAFGILKKKLLRRTKTRYLKLGLTESYNEIRGALSEIRGDVIQKCFAVFYQQIRQWMDSATATN